MAKRTAILLAIWASCLARVSFAGEWHVVSHGLAYRTPIFADSALGWSITRGIDTIWWDFDDCLFRTSDGGRTWQQMTFVQQCLTYTTFDDLCFKQGRLYIAQCNNEIGGGGFPVSYAISSSNQGASWYTFGGFPFDFVARLSVVDSMNIYAVADSCYKYDGIEWASKSFLQLDQYKKILFIDTTLGFIVNLFDGQVFRTNDGGCSWDTLAQIGQCADFYADGKNLWLLHDMNLLHSADTGTTWTPCDPGLGLAANCFSSFDTSNMWVGCDNGVVAHTADGGQSWERDTVGTTASVVSIYALSNIYVWAATADSTLWGLGVTGVSGHEQPTIPVPAMIFKAYPNPSRGHLTISYTTAAPGIGSVRVYDIAGRLVKTLASGPQAFGMRLVEWNWRNEQRGLCSGVYFIKSDIAGNDAVAKVVLIR